MTRIGGPGSGRTAGSPASLNVSTATSKTASRCGTTLRMRVIRRQGRRASDRVPQGHPVRAERHKRPPAVDECALAQAGACFARTAGSAWRRQARLISLRSSSSDSGGAVRSYLADACATVKAAQRIGGGCRATSCFPDHCRAGRREQVHMFEDCCSVCGVAACSSASYGTARVCPSCDSPLGDDRAVAIPEPDSTG